MYSTPYSPSTNSVNIMDFYNKSNPIEQFLHQLSGQEKDPDVVSIDHNYCKPWNAHPESNRAKPARMLFMKSLSRHPQSSQISPPDEAVDVESESGSVIPPYDTIKIRQQLEECDRYVKSNITDGVSDEKEEHVKKAGWPPMQKRLYAQVMKILQADRLAQLAVSASVNEPLKRRISLDKTARRLRHIFVANFWDLKLLRWLHLHLLDSLPSPMLAAYIDILRTLRAKTPHVIDKIMSIQSTHSSRLGLPSSSSAEALSQLFRKPWDPVLPLLHQHRPKKLPGNPLILVVPSGPNHAVVSQSRRMKFWYNHLSAMGKVIHASIPPVATAGEMETDAFLDQVVLTMKKKIVEMKSHFPDRPIVLLGWTIGSLMACHIAVEESVNAVVCLGFPLTGVNGSRGDLDDPLLESRIPTLFVIGQNSSTCSMDDIEDFRERMRAETGLVVVGGADDLLRVSHVKKKAEGVTQVMVDRCLLDEVGDFLASTINQQVFIPSNQQFSGKRVYTHSNVTQDQPQSPLVEDKRRRRKPKEYSPELSPVRRRSRQQVPRQIQAAQIPKALTSSSSSETSSTGSCASESMMVPSQVVKKSPVRKAGKQSTNVLKKRQIVKNSERGSSKSNSSLLTIKKEATLGYPIDHAQKDISKNTSAAAHQSETDAITSQKSLVANGMKVNHPVLAAANQQKNAPVDVEKAFGRDSSFLPRPLTPAEPSPLATTASSPFIPTTETEQTVSKSPMEDFNSPLKLNTEGATDEKLLRLVTLTNENISLQTSSKPTFIGMSPSTLTGFLSSAANRKITYVTSPVGSFPATFSTQVNSTVTIQKPQVVSSISDLSQTTNEHICIVPKLQDFSMATSNIITTNKSSVVTQPKILVGPGVNLKSVQSIASPLAGKSLLTTGVSSLRPQTVFVASPAPSNATTILVASSDSSSIPSKPVQLHKVFSKSSPSSPNKTSLPLFTKPVLSVNVLESVDCSSNGNSSKIVEPQVCNLSLLSDVAGMKERIKGMLDPEDSSNSTSTLSLISSPLDSEVLSLPTTKPLTLSTMKKIKLAEDSLAQVQTHSPPIRQETAEELAEKQMAIQVLSSSFNSDSDITSPYPKKDSSYSICYKKSDGSIVSRTVSKLRYPLSLSSAVISGNTGTKTVTMTRRGRGRTAPITASRKSRSQSAYQF